MKINHKNNENNDNNPKTNTVIMPHKIHQTSLVWRTLPHIHMNFGSPENNNVNDNDDNDNNNNNGSKNNDKQPLN